MVDKSHKIFEDEYKQFKNPFMFYDSIVVLHERKFLLLFWILNHIFFNISNWYMCIIIYFIIIS